MKVEGLSLEVVWHNEDLLQVDVRVGNADFSGAANVFCEHGTLREIAARIAGFPYGRGDHRQFILGAFDASAQGGGVEINLRCESNAGHSFADVRLQSEQREGRSSSASFTFPVEAGAIDHFVVDLRQLDDQRSGTARLPARNEGR